MYITLSSIDVMGQDSVSKGKTVLDVILIPLIMHTHRVQITLPMDTEF